MTYYDRLGVSPDASPTAIRAAYRRLALIHHPDKAGSQGHEAFQSIAEAAEVLLHATSRQHYDACLLQHVTMTVGRPGDVVVFSDLVLATGGITTCSHRDASCKCTLVHECRCSGEYKVKGPFAFIDDDGERLVPMTAECDTCSLVIRIV